MWQVSKYVDMEAKGFKGKSDFEVWHMLDDTTRQLVFAEYIGDRIEQSVMKLGKTVGSAVLSVMAVKKEE